jgi:peptide deformylase
LILKVSRLGHPVLRQVANDADPAEIAAGTYGQLIDDMFETMEAYRGVGLAGPQVHLPLRMFVYDSKDTEIDPTSRLRRGVIFNGTYEGIGEDAITDWEGCLSVPFLGGQVPRYRHVRLKGLDASGGPVEIEAEDFLARIFQHEVDHTDGHVYLDKMPDLESLSYTIVI